MDKYVDMRRLGERVLLLRRRAALSQHELAQQAGVDVMTISRLEGGDKKRLEIEPLARLARALHVSTDLLLGLQENALDTLPPPGQPEKPYRPGVESLTAYDARGASSTAVEAHSRRRGRPRKVTTLVSAGDQAPPDGY